MHIAIAGNIAVCRLFQEVRHREAGLLCNMEKEEGPVRHGDTGISVPAFRR